MRYSVTQAITWVTTYLVLATTPLVVTILGPVPPSRTFWGEFAVGLGFMGLTMIALQFVLTGRFRNIASTLGLDSMLRYHRQVGLIATGVILLHPTMLVVSDIDYLDYLNPTINPIRAVSLAAVIVALVLLIVSTIGRRWLQIQYEWWRLLHGLLALFVVIIGLIHILQVGFYVSVWWKQAFWIGITASAVLVLVNTRIVRPLLLRSRPYALDAIRRERGNAWTLDFEPRGHGGIRFEPGQYAWLTIARSPYSLQQHPFSFSSSADEVNHIAFTIKELGDFSATVSRLQPGTTAYIEGPYGAFTPSPDTSEGGVVFIAGGVGITPIMSMLRTFDSRRDPRRFLLIYGNGEWDNVLFREDLDALQERLNLEVVHVIERPPDDWTGERGRITPDLLSRVLPDDVSDIAEYFVCGPKPMMDTVERELTKRGAPLQTIHSERFDIV